MYLYSNQTNSIQTINFNYIVITNDYYNDNMIGYQYVANVSNNISSSNSRTIGLYLSAPFNITGGVSILVTYSGINAITSTI